jgi:hypothetical protein
MSERYRGTRIEQTPTFEGVAARAWRVTFPAVGARPVPDHDGTVGAFLVHAPSAHPLWDHYGVSMIHLRPIPGVRPAVITVPGATHEFMIVSLDPNEPLPSLDATAPDWKMRWLSPIDVVEQFAAADDVVADQVLELAVQAICNGHISPDQDYRSLWKHAIAETAAHFRDGTHSTGSRS